MEKNFKIEYHNVGTRIDAFLAKEYDEYSRELLKGQVKAGNILVNGASVKPNYKLQDDDEIACNIEIKNEPLDLTPKDIPLDIIYEDEHLAVINKQAGLTTHPGAGNNEDTLVNALLYKYKNLADRGGEDRLGIVHRLDKDTSGLMVVAFNNKSHYHLQKQIQNRTLIRKYHAVVHGLVTPPLGQVNANIARSAKDRTKMAIVQSGGREALTNYRTLKQINKARYSLVECKLETGRTHQIRVHMAHKRNPLIGDKTYGRNGETLFDRQALHSFFIEFEHPETKEVLSFEKHSSELEELIMRISV